MRLMDVVSLKAFPYVEFSINKIKVRAFRDEVYFFTVGAFAQPENLHHCQQLCSFIL